MIYSIYWLYTKQGKVKRRKEEEVEKKMFRERKPGGKLKNIEKVKLGNTHAIL